MSSAGAAPRAAVPGQQCPRRSEPPERREVARAEDRGGQGRSAQNALKHGMRAQKHLVLPDEDGAEFAGARGGAGRGAGAGRRAADRARAARRGRRVAAGAADRIEAELFEERRSADGGLGLALIRDGNGARSFETLLRYRGAAMAEFWRALRTLKALQAEQALGERSGHAALARPRSGLQRGRRSPSVHNRTNPSAAPARPEYLLSEPPAPGALHEPAAPWLPNEPESGADLRRVHLNQLPSSMEPATGLSARPGSDPRTSR